MSEADAVRAFANLDLDGFAGLAPGTRLEHVQQVLGPTDDGVHARLGYAHMWMRVFALPPSGRLTAWLDDQDDQEVRYLERPVDAGLAGWLDRHGSDQHRIIEAPHIVPLPGLGLCVMNDRRTRLPALIFAFVPSSPETFADSPLAFVE